MAWVAILVLNKKDTHNMQDVAFLANCHTVATLQ